MKEPHIYFDRSNDAKLNIEIENLHERIDRLKAENERLRRERDALRAALEWGGHTDGPTMLEEMAYDLEQQYGRCANADILREKAERERDALADTAGEEEQ